MKTDQWAFFSGRKHCSSLSSGRGMPNVITYNMLTDNDNFIELMSSASFNARTLAESLATFFRGQIKKELNEIYE